jgi:hypothetical protein
MRGNDRLVGKICDCCKTSLVLGQKDGRNEL